MQCIIAVLVGTWGVIGSQGAFLPIRTTEVLGKQCARTPLEEEALSESLSSTLAPDIVPTFRSAGRLTTWSLDPTSCTSTRERFDELPRIGSLVTAHLCAGARRVCLARGARSSSTRPASELRHDEIFI